MNEHIEIGRGVNSGARTGSWVVGLLIVSSILNWWNRDVINTDAISYMQIASYYADGKFNLAFNGYWGPLLSWMMVPFLKIGIDPMVAARTAMMISSLVFFSGADRVMAEFQLTDRPVVCGRLLFCCTAAVWGAQNITPDLLLAGLALFAIAFTHRAFRSGTMLPAIVAGLFWGLSYYSKAIALPWALLVIAMYTTVDLIERRVRILPIGQILVTLLIVVIPSIVMLSVEEERFTFSTSSKAAHALAGPADMNRYHAALSTLHEPRAGRVTSWENPVELPYATWSPFESKEYFGHQFGVVAANILKILFVITSLFPVWPLVIWIVVRDWNRGSFLETVRSAGPLDLLCLLYLPFYLTANEQRYFYIAVPLLWISMNLPRKVEGGYERVTRLSQRLSLVSVVLVLAALFFSMIAYQFPNRTAGRDARELARWLKQNEYSGSIAGSAMRPGGRAGLYTAWFLNRPWIGDERNADSTALIDSGADLIVVVSGDPKADELLKFTGVRQIELPPPLAEKFSVFKVR